MKDLCEASVLVIKEAAAFIRAGRAKLQRSDVETKALNSLVTYVDKGSEKILIEGLSKLLPGSSFLAEEETVERTTSDLEWIIDPLDGTTNFIHDLAPYAISVALSEKGIVVMGIVLEINSDECFYAWKSGGAFCNGKKIQVSPTPLLSDSMLATGFPYYDFSLLDSYMKLLNHFITRTRGIRRNGAAAVDLCNVACGRFEGYFEHSLSPWDVAAGSLIVEEAGGRVCDFKGGRDFLFGRAIIAHNNLIGESFEKVVQQYLIPTS